MSKKKKEKLYSPKAKYYSNFVAKVMLECIKNSDKKLFCYTDDYFHIVDECLAEVLWWTDMSEEYDDNEYPQWLEDIKDTCVYISTKDDMPLSREDLLNAKDDLKTCKTKIESMCWRSCYYILWGFDNLLNGGVICFNKYDWTLMLQMLTLISKSSEFGKLDIKRVWNYYQQNKEDQNNLSWGGWKKVVDPEITNNIGHSNFAEYFCLDSIANIFDAEIFDDTINETYFVKLDEKWAEYACVNKNNPEYIARVKSNIGKYVYLSYWGEPIQTIKEIDNFYPEAVYLMSCEDIVNYYRMIINKINKLEQLDIEREFFDNILIAHKLYHLNGRSDSEFENDFLSITLNPTR